MRRYPQPADYQGVIQNPHLVFSDPELKASTVRKNPMGLPMVSAGGFALSFYVDAAGGQRYVVRCFKAESLDRSERYAAISRFLNDHPHPIFLDVDYLEQGILVNGERFPIVKMPLVQGMTLHRYVEGEITAQRSVAGLSNNFRALVGVLEQLGVAHGDLQHGNIMVQNGELVLIDYDGMYVPALHGRQSPEKGHLSYQHPARNDQFNPELDRFSTLVIDMALAALAVKPGLWGKYSNGDNMLFRQPDLLEPDHSALLTELETIPALAGQAVAFRTICKGPLESVPSLRDFTVGKVVQAQPNVASWLPAAPVPRQAVYDARDREELLRHVGEFVTVVGRIEAFKQAYARNNQPYLFLNFGDYLNSPLALVIWSDALALFHQQKKQAADYDKHWVRVTGMLTTYVPGGSRLVQPQIVIDVPTQIELLPDAAVARQLLTAAASAPTVSKAVAVSTPAPLSKPSPAPTADFYNQINALYASPPKPQPAPQPKPVLPQLQPQLQPQPKSVQPVQSPPMQTQPVQQPTMVSLNIDCVPLSLHFGQIMPGAITTRWLQIVNKGHMPAVVSIEGHTPFLEATHPFVSCPAGGSVSVDVALHTGLIPPGMLEAIPAGQPAAGGQPLAFTLKDASLLLRCGGAEQMVAVSATIVQPAVPVQPVQPAVVNQAAVPPAQTGRRLGRISLLVSFTIFLVSLFATYPNLRANFVRGIAEIASSTGAGYAAAQPARAPVQPTSPAAERPAVHTLAQQGPVHGVATASAGLAAELETDTAVATRCPSEFPVNLFQPKDFLMTNDATFVWRADEMLAAPCHFQVTLWRSGRPRIALDAQKAVLRPDGSYALVLALIDLLPRNEQVEGIFSWTVELTLDGDEGQALATAAKPLTFYWMPEGK